MNRALRIVTLSGSLTLASAGGTACGGTASEAQASQVYATRGVVREIDLGNRRVTLQHEDVPGYMPAMTMPFEITSVDQVQGISVGDRVSFRFRAEGGRHIVVSMTKL